jgi:hydroxymethylpyrimidine/phosphomethylpyrimidine kinase
VQNTQGVRDVHLLDAPFVAAQLDAVLSDIPPRAAKTGALGGAAIIETIADRAASFDFPLVVDPVMISKHGSPLIDDDAISVLRDRLLPYAALITPNVHEAAALAGIDVHDENDMEAAARRMADLGPDAVLVTAGSIPGDATDILFADGKIHRFECPRVPDAPTHGSGCAFAAAITARLARGEPVVDAVTGAKRFITEAIRTAPRLGRGVGPTNLNAPI